MTKSAIFLLSCLWSIGSVEGNGPGTCGPPWPVKLYYLVQWSSTSAIEIREYMMHMVFDSAPQNADFRVYLLGGGAKLLADVSADYRQLFDRSELMKHTSAGNDVISSDTIDEALYQINTYKNKQKQVIYIVTDDKTVLNNVPRVLFKKETFFIIFGEESNDHYKSITGSLKHVITIPDRTKYKEAAQKVVNLTCIVSFFACDRDTFNEPRSTVCRDCDNICQGVYNKACLAHCPHYVNQSRQKEIIDAVKAEYNRYSQTVEDAPRPVDHKGIFILFVFIGLVVVVFIFALVICPFLRKMSRQVLHNIRVKMCSFFNPPQNNNVGTGQPDPEAPRDEPGVTTSLLNRYIVRDASANTAGRHSDPDPETDTSQPGGQNAETESCSQSHGTTSITVKDAFKNTDVFSGPMNDVQKGVPPADSTEY